MVRITRADGDPAAHHRRVGDMLTAFNAALGRPWAPIDVLLRAETDDGALAGGLAGRMVYGWLWVQLLAVDPDRRGAGVGARLMAEAERIARAEGAVGMNVDTFAFQAPGFYARQGFHEVSRLPGRTPEEDRIYFAKKL